MYRHSQLVMSKTLTREAGIHKFPCQNAPFLELMIDGLKYTGTVSW